MSKPMTWDAGSPSLAASRPQWPGMLDASDLTPGLEILFHRPGGFGRYQVVASPEGRQVRLAGYGYEVDVFLADMGMEPYSGGLWNPSNYATAAGDA